VRERRRPGDGSRDDVASVQAGEGPANIDMSDRRSLLVATLGFVLLKNWRSVPELVTLHAWLATSTQTEHCRRGHPFLARENHVASGYASGKGAPGPRSERVQGF